MRHSLPAVDPQIEPSKWRLTPEGRRLAGPLAPTLTSVDSVVSSRERKAIETAAIAAARLDLTPEQHPGLNEHRRRPGDWRSASDFEAVLKQLFLRRSEVVFGRESADQAERRFGTAISEVMERHVGDSAIVTHGTVMALFVSRAAGWIRGRCGRGLECPQASRCRGHSSNCSTLSRAMAEERARFIRGNPTPEW